MSEKMPLNPDVGFESLSDEDFVKEFPANGSGWGTLPNPNNDPSVEKVNELAQSIWARHLNLMQTKPYLYEVPPTNSQEELPNILSRQLTRNLDGQVVNPRTNEPIRRGSREDQELGRRNMRPL